MSFLVSLGDILVVIIFQRQCSVTMVLYHSINHKNGPDNVRMYFAVSGLGSPGTVTIQYFLAPVLFQHCKQTGLMAPSHFEWSLDLSSLVVLALHPVQV